VIGLRRVLRDLWRSADPPGIRSVIRSLLYLIPVALAVSALYADLYSGTAAPTTTAHPEQSINVALNAHFCGKPSGMSQRFSVQVFLSTRLDLMSQPFRGVINRQAGGVGEYCATVTDKVVVSESSLMWLTRLALRANSHLTPDGLGQFLGACRVAMLLVFGFALLRTGASVLFTLAAVLVGCAILRAVAIRDSISPFVLALPLLHAGIYGAVRSSGFTRALRWGFWAFALGMGVLTAFSGSMRTILLPTCAAMFAVFLFALRKGRTGNQRVAGRLKVRAALPAVGAFAAGYFAYLAIFIYPLRIPDDPNVPNFTYHTVIHQLVLGLAVPENEFSRRERIEWKDESGLEIARRVMPQMTYFGPEYEAALLQYYRGLWRKYPRDMAAVYWEKLRSAGSEVFLSAATVGTQFGIPRGPGEWLHRVTNGPMLIALGVVMFVVALRRHLRGDGDGNLIVALLSLAALAALAEAFLVYSIFVGMYYSELLFFVFFASLILAQAAVDAIARTVERYQGVAGPQHQRAVG
jgi:hypothetical protein